MGLADDQTLLLHLLRQAGDARVSAASAENLLLLGWFRGVRCVLLELDAKATDEQIVEAIKGLQAQVQEKPEPETATKTLAQQAADEGKILLDADKFTQLAADAQAGALAAKQLHETRFETAFEKAVNAGKAVPAQKDAKHRFFELDADAAVKELEDGPQIVNVRPQGSPIQAETAAPAGVDQGSHDLHQRILTRMGEKSRSLSQDGAYEETLKELMGEDVNGR